MSEQDGIMVLPDGSAFSVLSLPLPADHWLYERDADGFALPPPMPWRTGEGPERDALARQIWVAARYAIRAATMHGTEMDFDPDALAMQFVVGLLGYWTPDGLSGKTWGNPDPVPPLGGGPAVQGR